MRGLDRMDEEGGGAGGGEGRRHLGTDMAAFAYAGHDKPAAKPRNERDRLRERLGQVALQRDRQRFHAGLFGRHRAQG